MAQPLEKQEIEEALESSLEGWNFEGNKLKKEFSFQNFREAMTFITRISYEAEDMVHHPEIFNVYNTVNIALTTHEADDSVTEKDVKLAKNIQTLFNKYYS
ncbi:MAG TPA: 4a-hydroxytetrahydrobiopterin dehydratase [Balneolaceae bacterium]|nr:4a-hydroxytetrahydrobiopterin dehydratase [Balneolaceae bacterium]